MTTVIKKLPSPWVVGGQSATEIEVRPYTVADLIEAEKDAVSVQANTFTVALAAQQMVRAGTFTGPFVMSQFKTMTKKQFDALRDALREVEELGEGTASGT